MRVLVTGAAGTAGTAPIEHLGDRDEYEFTYLDREPLDDVEMVAADCTDYDEGYPHIEGRDAVVHLAAHPYTDASWEQLQRDNLVATDTVLAAASAAGVESVVLGATHHVVGTDEVGNAPGLYTPEFDTTLDESVPRRPDSMCGTAKGSTRTWGGSTSRTPNIPSGSTPSG